MREFASKVDLIILKTLVCQNIKKLTYFYDKNLHTKNTKCYELFVLKLVVFRLLVAIAAAVAWFSVTLQVHI